MPPLPDTPESQLLHARRVIVYPVLPSPKTLSQLSLLPVERRLLWPRHELLFLLLTISHLHPQLQLLGAVEASVEHKQVPLSESLAQEKSIVVRICRQ